MLTKLFNGLSPSILPESAFYNNTGFRIKAGYDIGPTQLTVDFGRYYAQNNSYTGIESELTSYAISHEAKALNDLYPSLTREKSNGANYLQPIDIGQVIGSVIDTYSISPSQSEYELGVSSITESATAYSVAPGVSDLASIHTLIQTSYSNPHVTAEFRPLNRVEGSTETRFKILLDYTDDSYLSYEVFGATAEYKYTNNTGYSILSSYSHGLSYNTGFSASTDMLKLSALIANNYFIGGVGIGETVIYHNGITLPNLIRKASEAGFGAENTGSSFVILAREVTAYDLSSTASAYDIVAEGLNHVGISLYIGTPLTSGLTFSPGVSRNGAEFIFGNGASPYSGYQLVLQDSTSSTFIADATIAGSTGNRWSAGIVTPTTAKFITGFIGDTYGHSFAMVTTINNMATILSTAPIKTGFGLPAGSHNLRVAVDDFSLSFYINQRRIYLETIYAFGETNGVLFGSGLSTAGQSVTFNNVFFKDYDSIDEILLFPQDTSIARGIQNALPAESFLHYESQIAEIRSVGQTNTLYGLSLVASALSASLQRDAQNTVSVNTIFKNGHINVITGRTDYYFNVNNNVNSSVQLRRSLALSDIQQQGLNILSTNASNANNYQTAIAWSPYISRGEYVVMPEEFGRSEVLVVAEVRHQLNMNGSAITNLTLSRYEQQ